MALQTANDALIAFSQALSAPGDSEQQITILASVRNAIEAQPHFLPALYSTILSVAARAGNVLVRWIADIVELVVARLGVTSNALSGEQRTHSESSYVCMYEWCGVLGLVSVDGYYVFFLAAEAISGCLYCRVRELGVKNKMISKHT